MPSRPRKTAAERNAERAKVRALNEAGVVIEPVEALPVPSLPTWTDLASRYGFSLHADVSPFTNRELFHAVVVGREHLGWKSVAEISGKRQRELREAACVSMRTFEREFGAMPSVVAAVEDGRGSYFADGLGVLDGPRGQDCLRGIENLFAAIESWLAYRDQHRGAPIELVTVPNAAEIAAEEERAEREAREADPWLDLRRAATAAYDSEAPQLVFVPVNARHLASNGDLNKAYYAQAHPKVMLELLARIDSAEGRT